METSLTVGNDGADALIGKPGDPLMTTLAKARTVDAVGLKLDFVPALIAETASPALKRRLRAQFFV